MNIMRKTLAIYTAAISLLALSCVPEVGAAQRLPKVIVIRPDASELECLAANEVRRYVYLRTGRVMQVKKGATGGDQIAVTCKSREFCGELGQELEPQQFRLKTVVADRGIGRLERGDGRDGAAPLQLRHAAVGDADPADLAFLLEPRQRLPALFEILIRLRPVDLVEVDRVDF